MKIEIIDEHEALTPSLESLISQVLLYAAKSLSLPHNSEMSVSIVDNASIQNINRTYRNKDVPTDVISFAANESLTSTDPFSLIDDALDYELGDIFISIEKAREQAIMYGHSVERELAFLAVHGFLHLNGYDHETLEDEQEMFSLQQTLLDECGLVR